MFLVSYSLLLMFSSIGQCYGSGSWIRCLFDPWIRDPGWVKSQDPDRDRIEKIRIRDPIWKKVGYGINIPDPQHCCWVIGFRDIFFSRDSKGRNSQPWCVLPVLILLLFSGTQNEPAVQMCSTSGQQCVFPFTYKGKTLNLRTCSLYGIVRNTESTVKICLFLDIHYLVPYRL
jgi:hypothetical protein